MVNSLYIHFPYCIHLCNYCDFYKRKFESEQQVEEYLELAESQLHELIRLHEKKQVAFSSLETLYIGGGTPSLFKPDRMKRLLELMSEKNIKLAGSNEFTIEIDPGTFDEEDLDQWISLGVNRFSVGVQAFEEEHLKWLDRRHTKAEVEESLLLLKKKGLNFSVDLIIGSPDSVERDLSNEIHELDSLGARHFSVYILSTRANYPHKSIIPNDEIVRDQYLSVSKTLSEIGYGHYEVSNFAKGEGFESAHNKKYWDYSSVAALGPNASGTICSHDEVLRYQWKSLSAGFQQELVQGESLVMEKLFLSLRRSAPSDLAAIIGGKSPQKLQSKLENWLQLGYVFPDSKIENLRVTPLGFLMNDSMINDLMDLF